MKEEKTIEAAARSLLAEAERAGVMLASAESCTGGNIAARFTAMPGASAYFLCGVVSYSNGSHLFPEAPQR